MLKKTISLFLAFVMLASAFCMAPALASSEEPQDASGEAEELVFGTAEGFQHAAELPEGASFVRIAWLDADVYAYTPSELYADNTSMMQVFYLYPDAPLADINAAWDKLTAAGLDALAEELRGVVFIIEPLDGASYTAEDYDITWKLSKALSGTGRGETLDFEFTFPYDKIILKKLYMLGEGGGADFIATALTDDLFSGMTAAQVLVNAQAAPAEANEPIPAFLLNCGEDVVDYYKAINGTDAETADDPTTNGLTAYYNSGYVMDSGYTPERVIVSADAVTELDAAAVREAWDILLKRVWRDSLIADFFNADDSGKYYAGAVADRPVPEELGLVFNWVSGEEAEGTNQTEWFEWVPEEVYDTMADPADDTVYPLIIVFHGNGDHEIYEAESNGWVTLAGQERLIVAAMSEIFEPGFPPESAEHRYGASNTEFVRDVLCERYPVDMSRIYVAGFSAGAFATADTAAAGADLFAGAASMAYPGDGKMQIFPYDEYGTDAAAYDIPVYYMCGRSDQGNTRTMDGIDGRLSTIQLYFNQIMTFNEMTDMLIDLEDFEYDWYPGENDPRTNWQTGETTGGYDFWDGTAAEYICQDLDFVKYPFLGYDPLSLGDVSRDDFTTPEGVDVEMYQYHNAQGWPMITQLVMGDMGHFHYTRYARIIWDNVFSHFTRDPATGVLSYDGVPAAK